MLRLRAFVFSFLLLAGCSGGFDCPFDIPSCCYNVLFGCGPFDLPDGCSCSDYGLNYSSAKVALTTTRTSSAKTLTGRWSGALQRKSATCAATVKRVSGIVTIKEQTNRISVSVPGYGKLRGLKTLRGYTASGQYKLPFSACSANIRINFTKTGVGIGTLNAQMSYSCGSRNQCSAVYSGTVQQW